MQNICVIQIGAGRELKFGVANFVQTNLVSRQADGEEKSSTCSDFTFSPNLFIQTADDLSGNCQTQAAAACIKVVIFFIKTVKQMG